MILYSVQVVGSQARILYSDQKGRTAIALAFNDAVNSGKLKVRESATMMAKYIIEIKHIDVSEEGMRWDEEIKGRQNRGTERERRGREARRSLKGWLE